MLMYWHSKLDMPKYDKEWHIQDMADEYAELQEATGIIHKWSELSDVAYTYSRAKWSGHAVDLPITKKDYFTGLAYMYPKYTSRYYFFRRAGIRTKSYKKLKEVRNPKKTHKLHTIAERYNLDKQEFQNNCEKQLKYWVLLP